MFGIIPPEIDVQILTCIARFQAQCERSFTGKVFLECLDFSRTGRGFPNQVMILNTICPFDDSGTLTGDRPAFNCKSTASYWRSAAITCVRIGAVATDGDDFCNTPFLMLKVSMSLMVTLIEEAMRSRKCLVLSNSTHSLMMANS